MRACESVCVCARARVRVCVRARVRACVRACVCVCVDLCAGCSAIYCKKNEKNQKPFLVCEIIDKQYDLGQWLTLLACLLCLLDLGCSSDIGVLSGTIGQQ